MLKILVWLEVHIWDSKLEAALSMDTAIFFCIGEAGLPLRTPVCPIFSFSVQGYAVLFDPRTWPQPSPHSLSYTHIELVGNLLTLPTNILKVETVPGAPVPSSLSKPLWFRTWVTTVASKWLTRF